MKTGMMVEHETEPVKYDIYAVLQGVSVVMIIIGLAFVAMAIMGGPHAL